MIQRIQSIYLLLASGSIFGQFEIPYLTGMPGILPVFSDGQLNPLDNIGLLGLTVLGGTLALVTIFLFKNRTLQGRLTGGALLASILLLALAAFTTYRTTKIVQPGTEAHWHAGLALPLVASVMLWLAGRAIRKDENLVRSMDRLR